MELPESSKSPTPRWLLISLILVVLLASVVWWRRAGSPGQITPETAAAPGPGAATETPPWGLLERYRITIERPRALTSASPERYPPETKWFFGNAEPAALASLFQSLALPAPFLDQSRWMVQPRGISVTVTPEQVLGLPAKARQQLYPLLAHFPENEAQSQAYSFPIDTAGDWFTDSELSPQTLALVTNRLYRQGDTLCFADLGEVLTQIKASDERVRLVKTLSRETTILMKLHVDAHTDVDALLKYWGRQGRAKDLEPLLESLKRIPGGASIDVVHLLPPFARMRLYTYPLPLPNAKELVQDCFWTSFNFFNEPPENRFGDTAGVKAALDKDYYIAQDDPRFGDLLMLVDQHGRAIHAAVYVADDVVFTKNGAAFTHPWLLMDLRDVLTLYGVDGPPRVIFYRLKDDD